MQQGVVFQQRQRLADYLGASRGRGASSGKCCRQYAPEGGTSFPAYPAGNLLFDMPNSEAGLGLSKLSMQIATYGVLTEVVNIPLHQLQSSAREQSLICLSHL